MTDASQDPAQTEGGHDRAASARRAASADRVEHAPDPHIFYARHELPGDGALPDGPVLAAGPGGVRMIPAGDPDAAPVADAPGGTLYRFPRMSELASLSGTVHSIATFQDEPVYAVSTTADAASDLTEVGYRELYGTIGDDELALVGRAIQIVDWDESSRYCPRCGSPTDAEANEGVKRCSSCGLTQYPRLAPAMIVGVVRDGKLLLGQSPRFAGRFHSILAGFLEPGETMEECVQREVYEEVGISVGNIRYFGSQPWPFPHSFMIGFTAEYESGELDPDPAEIIHADWYAPHELPNVPGEVSISGRIINWFRKTYG